MSYKTSRARRALIRHCARPYLLQQNRLVKKVFRNGNVNAQLSKRVLSPSARVRTLFRLPDRHPPRVDTLSAGRMAFSLTLRSHVGRRTRGPLPQNSAIRVARVKMPGLACLKTTLLLLRGKAGAETPIASPLSLGTCIPISFQ